MTAENFNLVTEDEMFARVAIGYYDDKPGMEFMEDALTALGIKGHRNAGKAYRLAWEYGHASGRHEVWYYLRDLAELLK